METEVIKDNLPEIPNVETAGGKDLDPLLNPPVDQMTVVQVLKQKIDAYVYKVTNYKGSRQQLKQVMAYLAMHPFTENAPKFGYPEQTEIYDLGVQILTDKLLFFQIGIKEQEIAKQIRESSPEKDSGENTVTEPEYLKEKTHGTKEN